MTIFLHTLVSWRYSTGLLFDKKLKGVDFKHSLLRMACSKCGQPGHNRKTCTIDLQKITWPPSQVERSPSPTHPDIFQVFYLDEKGAEQQFNEEFGLEPWMRPIDISQKQMDEVTPLIWQKLKHSSYSKYHPYNYIDILDIVCDVLIKTRA